MRMCGCEDMWILFSDVKRLSVYQLSFIFLVLVFEFQKPIIVSNLALSSWPKDASPRSAEIGRLVSLTDTSLHCVTWYSSKMKGHAGEEYIAFRATLSPGRSPTWVWLAHDWHRKWRMIVVVVLDAAARCRIAPCRNQLLSLSQNTFHTATGRLTSKHRARLSPDHADCLAFLNKTVIQLVSLRERPIWVKRPMSDVWIQANKFWCPIPMFSCAVKL